MVAVLYMLPAELKWYINEQVLWQKVMRVKRTDRSLYKYARHKLSQ